MSGLQSHPDFDNLDLWDEIFATLPDGFEDGPSEEDPNPSLVRVTEAGDISVFVTLKKAWEAGSPTDSVIIRFEHHDDPNEDIEEVFARDHLEDAVALVHKLIARR